MDLLEFMKSERFDVVHVGRRSCLLFTLMPGSVQPTSCRGGRRLSSRILRNTNERTFAGTETAFFGPPLIFESRQEDFRFGHVYGRLRHVDDTGPRTYDDVLNLI